MSDAQKKQRRRSKLVRIHLLVRVKITALVAAIDLMFSVHLLVRVKIAAVISAVILFSVQLKVYILFSTWF